MADLRASAHPPTGHGDDDDIPEPAPLRALRRMVSLLTATLIVGVVVVAGALVVRLARPAAPPAAVVPSPFDPASVSAERIRLPDDESVVATGAAQGALILATRDGRGVERLRFFDAGTGRETGAVVIDRANR
jgi:hypothetical protein